MREAGVTRECVYMSAWSFGFSNIKHDDPAAGGTF